MDQIKIGQFIAACRKEEKLTQLQLADKLGITDKAISKWERGKAMPDSALMLELCAILNISVNDLLSGEKTSMENINRKNEQLLLDMTKELEKKNRTIWKSMWAILAVSFVGLMAGIFLAAALIPEGLWQVAAMLGLCVVFLIPCFYALKLEVSVGAYKCKRCGGEVTPTYFQALMALHMGTTRYLKCPHCKKCSWCKKILTKE